MPEIKLKPCPFCGGEMTVCGSSRLKRFTISHRGDRKCHFYAFEIDWQTVDSIAEAIEAWNKRAKPEYGMWLYDKQKHGTWLYNKNDDMFHCSECGDGAVYNVYNYCMWCGAKMDEEVSG